jgi:predicted small secreted protein
MKKLLIIVLALISITASAGSTITSVGRLTDYVGNRVLVSISDNGREKTVYVMIRGRHNIRKAGLGLNKKETQALIRLLNKSIEGM